MGCSRLMGVPKTVKLIKRLSLMLPLDGESLNHISENIDLIYKRTRYLLLAQKQKCLIRGFLIFFYGKRLGAAIRLVFGVQMEDRDPKWHCWLVEEENLLFEVDEVISRYVQMVEYT